jgi:hypothetical protein
VFERIVEACIAAGLVGGEGFAVDASLIAADANKKRSIAGQDWRRDRDPERSSCAVNGKATRALSTNSGKLTAHPSKNEGRVSHWR